MVYFCRAWSQLASYTWLQYGRAISMLQHTVKQINFKGQKFRVVHKFSQNLTMKIFRHSMEFIVFLRPY